MVKTKLFVNCFLNLTSPCTTEKWRKQNSVAKSGCNQIQGSNQRLIVPLNHPAFWCQTQCSEGYYTFEPGLTGNTLQISTFYTDTWNSYGWAAATALVCRTLVEADGNSPSGQWFEFEITLCDSHSPATRRRWINDKKLWSGQSLAPMYTWRSWSWRWHSKADRHTGEQYSMIGRTNA